MQMLAALASHEPALLGEILLLYGDPRTVGALASTCTELKRFVASSDVWRSLLKLRWAIDLPSNIAFSKHEMQHAARHDSSSSMDAAKLLRWLELDVKSVMSRSFHRAFQCMADHGLLSMPSNAEVYWETTQWEATARALLDWLPMNEKRRLAAFVCSEKHPKACLRRFLRLFSLKGCQTPVEALRLLLLQFPFLPIDAGSGADRVISQFAYNWVADNPESLGNIGMNASSALSDSHDAVYSLTYSIIMLNTDLHNPVTMHAQDRGVGVWGERNGTRQCVTADLLRFCMWMRESAYRHCGVNPSPGPLGRESALCCTCQHASMLSSADPR